MARGVAVHVPFGPLHEATFVARPNRFLVEARLDGRLVRAHLADRGRLLETLTPGVRLLLAARPGPGRTTPYQAIAAVLPDRGAERLVSLDTHMPNRLVAAALSAGALPPFSAAATVRREVRIGGSRFDFLVTEPSGQRCVLEVKSAALVRGAVAWFPDAPTARGVRHVEELIELARGGEQTALVFIAPGAPRAVALDLTIDPGFAGAVAAARAAGVHVSGYACPIDRSGVTFGSGVPVWCTMAEQNAEQEQHDERDNGRTRDRRAGDGVRPAT